MAGFLEGLVAELQELLSDLGVECFGAAEGELFNAKRHQIIETAPSDDPAHFNAVKVARRPGYEHVNADTDRRTILRHAKVTVYKAPRPVVPAMSATGAASGAEPMAAPGEETK